MGRKVVWTDPAAEDVVDTVEYIAKDSPSFAATLAQRICDAGDSLEEFSERGRPYPDPAYPGFRELLYARGLSDFGLADSVGNLGGIIVQIFLPVAAFNATREQSFRIAAFVSLGFIAYEFVQPYLPKGVFDWGDVAATALGYAISCVVLWVIWRLWDPRNGRSNP